MRGANIRAHNIVTQAPGVLGNAKNAKSVLDCWEILFSDDMIDLISKYTNDEIERKQVNYTKNNSVKKTDMSEIKAVFGLLYLASFYKSNHQNLVDLWATDAAGVVLFRSTMSLIRFRFLLRCLRFDNRSTRANRRSYDKLAPIRKFFDKFNDVCESVYSSGENVTIVEKLEAFHGRCSFRQYIPSKPAKYGLKVIALVDAKSFYTSKLEVYVGAQPEGPYKVSSTPFDVVTRLIARISETGRNVTLDNWFTSYPLATSLLEDQKLTMVETMKKNKRELPLAFRNIKQRSLMTTVFGFQPNITIASFVPKKTKNVVMISTLHYDDNVDERTSKPEIILFCNQTKGGVDVVDGMSALLQCKSTESSLALDFTFFLIEC